ncbi:MAG: phage portal protein [Chitinophagaceae bacterium]|nr:phage portal protein [Chitinophagaceae bacterium]
MKRNDVNFIDRIITFVNPAWGLSRIQNRLAAGTLMRHQSYEGARRDRRTKGWNVNEYEEAALLTEIKTLKNRSRDLYRNNTYSHRAHNSIANNTTGTGIVPAIKDNRLKKAWKDWASETSVDFDENLNFYGIQNLCMRTMSMHGEVLILRIKTNKSKAQEIPLELKVISTKFLDSGKDTSLSKNGYISGGIEFDQNGKKKGYWIFPVDPSVDHSISKFWSKEDVIHLFFQDEPGQIHGVPFGSSAIISLRDFDDYSDAQLMRQKIAACFSVFITKTDGEMMGGLEPSDGDQHLERVEPGIIEHLEPGKSVTFASPPPAEGYGEYSRNILTGVASGYGMSYEAMTGDLSNVNYSSGRMGYLEYQRSIEAWQHFILIPKLCRGVWRWFVNAGIIAGVISKDADLNIEWTAPGRKMIDPVKEVNGLREQVRAGFMSWQEAVRSLGYSPDEILEELKTAAAEFDKAGIQPKCDPRFDAANLRAAEGAEASE